VFKNDIEIGLKSFLPWPLSMLPLDGFECVFGLYEKVAKNGTEISQN
jgi:hypothetical protein